MRDVIVMMLPALYLVLILISTVMEFVVIPKQRKKYLEEMDKRIALFQKISNFIHEKLTPEEEL